MGTVRLHQSQRFARFTIEHLHQARIVDRAQVRYFLAVPERNQLGDDTDGNLLRADRAQVEAYRSIEPLEGDAAAARRDALYQPEHLAPAADEADVARLP